MEKLWINAGLKVTDDQSTEKATKALITLQQETIKESGCVFFHVLQSKEDPSLFTLWEEWTNEQALKDHFDQPHTKAYLSQSLTEVTYIEKLTKLT